MQMINLPTLGIKTLSDLTSVVSSENVDSVLSLNNIERTTNIADAYKKVCDAAKDSIQGNISLQSKINMVGKYTSDSDIFEIIATSSEDDWKILQQNGTISSYLKLPDEINIPLVAGIVGNNNPVSRQVYESTINNLKLNNSVPESIFTPYNSSNLSTSQDMNVSAFSSPNVFFWFHIPWGEVTLYSSIDGTSVDFPVYPEELQDGRSANYDTMPDLLYQYEPWQVYKGSGPRKVTYKFDFHRDMWTGDHRDGKAAELISFCNACCYPHYDGAAVNTPTVDLYIGGQKHISGVLTECNPDWDGPLGLDNFWLHCVLSISIIEVSPIPLNYDSVKSLPLIGYN